MLRAAGRPTCAVCGAARVAPDTLNPECFLECTMLPHVLSCAAPTAESCWAGSLESEEGARKQPMT